MKKKISKNIDATSQMLQYFLKLEKALVEKLTGEVFPDFAFLENKEIEEEVNEDSE